jgi:hypothetical protein
MVVNILSIQSPPPPPINFYKQKIIIIMYIISIFYQENCCICKIKLSSYKHSFLTEIIKINITKMQYFHNYIIEDLQYFKIYYINVKSPNLDLKLGIKHKAGNFLSGKREGERQGAGPGGGKRETEIGR